MEQKGTRIVLWVVALLLGLLCLVGGCGPTRRQDPSFEVWWTWNGEHWVLDDGRTLEQAYEEGTAE